MYDALSIAYYIINYGNHRGMGISNLKLQKILYFVQANFLVSTHDHRPCFSDRIEAWDFGPVVPNVYHQYKVYGSAIIPPNPNDPLRSFYQEILEQDKGMIDIMVDQTASYSASQLVQLTHNQSPWRNAYRPNCNNEISNDSILHFFKD